MKHPIHGNEANASGNQSRKCESPDQCKHGVPDKHRQLPGMHRRSASAARGSTQAACRGAGESKGIGMTRVQFVAVMTSDEFTAGEKFICQAQYANATLSGFDRALWNILCVADEDNRSKLALGFPEHAAALRQWIRGDLRHRLEAVGVEERA